MTIENQELYKRLKEIKLLAMDVDGVLTDGGLYYTDSGLEMKKFNVKDGQGLKFLHEVGIKIAIISASSASTILHRAEVLGINYAFIGIEDKLKTLLDLSVKLSLNFSQIAYIGDDLNDLPILQAVGCPFTVADAMPINKKQAIYVTEKCGGQGAVREICDLLISAILD